MSDIGYRDIALSIRCLVLTHFLIYLSAHLCHPHHSHQFIYRSFTLSLQTQNLPFQQILPTLILLLPWTAFTITGPDLSCFSDYFQFVLSLTFLFVLCGGLSWLHISILLHVKYIVSYGIVQFRTDVVTAQTHGREQCWQTAVGNDPRITGTQVNAQIDGPGIFLTTSTSLIKNVPCTHTRTRHGI